MSFFGDVSKWFKEKRIALGRGTPLNNAPGSSSNKNKASLIKRLGLAFTTSSGAAAKITFEEPTYGFNDITAAYNTDGYVRQAVDKYVDLIFKSNWDIVGKNQAAVDYVNIRLAAAAEATGSNTRQFLRELGEDLVKYANVFIVKARTSGSYVYPPGVKVSEVNGKTVAGYYILPPATIQIAREESGTIANYQQKITGKTAIEFKPSDIIHIAWKKERGQAFGVSFLTPVLDDVKILRQIEEDVVRLIYRELFPLHTYTVGIDKPGYQANDEEIAKVKEMIQNMPLDGGIVIPERHKIEIVGSQGKALAVADYLDYFRARVFSGLGVSESIMGVGGATNRATAESMSDEMKDRIKAFQRVIEDHLESFVINELLREGGYDPLLNPEDKVQFKFREIDLDARTKLEQSSTQLWNNNLVTFEEARNIIGLEPVVDESRLFGNMVKAGIAADSTATASATEKAGKTSLLLESHTSSVVQRLVDEHIKQLERHWDMTRSDVLDMIKHYYLSGSRSLEQYNPKEINTIINLTIDSVDKIAEPKIRSAFMAGIDAARASLHSSSNKVPHINYAGYIKEVTDIHAKQIRALLEEDLNHLIKVAMRADTPENALNKVIGAFNSLAFRLNCIADYQIKKAYFYGMVRCGEWFECESFQIQSTDNCSICSGKSNAVIDIKTASIYKSIPPFHPSCNCSLKILGKEMD